MRKSLSYILEKLPDYTLKIIELYNKDEDFRILCEDYLASAEALEECRKNAAKEQEFENEFVEVLIELEQEINHLLKLR